MVFFFFLLLSSFFFREAEGEGAIWVRGGGGKGISPCCNERFPLSPPPPSSGVPLSFWCAICHLPPSFSSERKKKMQMKKKGFPTFFELKIFCHVLCQHAMQKNGREGEEEVKRPPSVKPRKKEKNKGSSENFTLRSFAIQAFFFFCSPRPPPGNGPFYTSASSQSFQISQGFSSLSLSFFFS